MTEAVRFDPEAFVAACVQIRQWYAEVAPLLVETIVKCTDVFKAFALYMPTRPAYTQRQRLIALRRAATASRMRRMAT